MEFKNSLLELAGRVDKLLPGIQREEATKTSLVLPFIKLLGYDIHNPYEVSAEFIAYFDAG